MKVYIQKEAGEFIDESAFSLFWGFTALRIPAYSFEGSPPTIRKRNDIVYGKIGVVLDSLKDINVLPPEPLTIPKELLSFLGRSIRESTLRDVRNCNLSLPIFIKPLYENKLFNGHVLNSNIDLAYTEKFNENTPIFISEYVEFVSEYRGFVLKGNLVGCKHYKGDFTVFPDIKVMCDAVRKIKKPNIAYSIDFGVTKSGKTLLIELNDTYSLRSYGLPSRLFCEIVRIRWKEIVSNSV